MPVFQDYNFPPPQLRKPSTITYAETKLHKDILFLGLFNDTVLNAQVINVKISKYTSQTVQVTHNTFSVSEFFSLILLYREVPLTINHSNL
jgi:hypothetical protein